MAESVDNPANETNLIKKKVEKFFSDKNRPFSLNDVIAHLQREISCKASISKAVDALGQISILSDNLWVEILTCLKPRPQF